MATGSTDGGSAFPHPGVCGGMTLRDYFAGQALTGIIASPHWAALPDPDELARRAFIYADAMLRAREVK